ncbi:MAG: hypothetical protein ACK415_12905, partial [Thermodesulfovibrionales bacterium]
TCIEDPVKRRALFIGILTDEIRRRGGKCPIIVGGIALEIYTQGSYTTGDIDIKAPKEILETILKEWQFIKKGRVWFNEELDIYIDWLGASLDEGKEAEERVNTIIVGDGLEINVISIEDLIIDRLNACKWWQDEDSLMWAKVLLKIKIAMGEPIDKEYLRKRASVEKVEELLEELLME